MFFPCSLRPHADGPAHRNANQGAAYRYPISHANLLADFDIYRHTDTDQRRTDTHAHAHAYANTYTHTHVTATRG